MTTSETQWEFYNLSFADVVSPVSALDHHEDHAAPTVLSHIFADSHTHFGSSQQRLMAVRLPCFSHG